MFNSPQYSHKGVRDGVKQALRLFLDVVNRAEEIRLCAMRSSKKIGNVISFEYSELSDSPTDTLALAFILVKQDLAINQDLGKSLFKLGMKKLESQDDSKAGRPVNVSNKLVEVETSLLICDDSDVLGSSLNSLYKKYANKLHKSPETIRRNYERFNKENPSIEDKLSAYYEIVSIQTEKVARSYFFCRATDTNIDVYQSALPEKLEILGKSYEHYLHYLDDFELFKEVLSEFQSHSLETALSLMDERSIGGDIQKAHDIWIKNNQLFFLSDSGKLEVLKDLLGYGENVS